MYALLIEIKTLNLEGHSCTKEARPFLQYDPSKVQKGLSTLNQF